VSTLLSVMMYRDCLLSTIDFLLYAFMAYHLCLPNPFPLTRYTFANAPCPNTLQNSKSRGPSGREAWYLLKKVGVS
jgi:hypothetical protein